MNKNKVIFSMLAVLIALSLVLTACGSSNVDAPEDSMPAAVDEVVEESETGDSQTTEVEVTDKQTSSDRTNLSMWYHGAGNAVEREILLSIIDDYNNSQDKYIVEVQDFRCRSAGRDWPLGRAALGQSAGSTSEGSSQTGFQMCHRTEKNPPWRTLANWDPGD